MKHATDEDLAAAKAQAGLKHATDEDLEQAKHKAGLDRQNTSIFRDDDSISTKATTMDEGVAEEKETEPEPEKKKKRRSWFGSRGSRPSTSESRPGTGDKPKRRSFLSRFSRGSRASTPGEGEERKPRDDDDTHTFTETIDDTAFDDTTLDTEAYELRERDRKRAKKAIKDAREWLRDPTPLWARCTNWRFDVCVGITPRRRRGASSRDLARNALKIETETTHFHHSWRRRASTA